MDRHSHEDDRKVDQWSSALVGARSRQGAVEPPADRMGSRTHLIDELTDELETLCAAVFKQQMASGRIDYLKDLSESGDLNGMEDDWDPIRHLNERAIQDVADARAEIQEQMRGDGVRTKFTLLVRLLGEEKHERDFAEPSARI